MIKVTFQKTNLNEYFAPLDDAFYIGIDGNTFSIKGDTGIVINTFTGPSGFKGITGSDGPQGNIGSSGPLGPNGTTGNIGVNGSDGTTGHFGATGQQGAIGEYGVQGESGPFGFIGVTGPDSETGSTGNQGDVGPAGLNGDTGVQGPLGPTGNAGETGTIGPQGNVGSKGLTGIQGPAGPQGLTGPVEFKLYVAKVMFNTTGGFTVSQFYNTLGDGSGDGTNDISWTSTSIGIGPGDIYAIFSDGTAYTLNKTFVSVSSILDTNGTAFFVSSTPNRTVFGGAGGKTVSLRFTRHDNVVTRPNFTQLFVQIKVYD